MLKKKEDKEGKIRPLRKLKAEISQMFSRYQVLKVNELPNGSQKPFCRI